MAQHRHHTRPADLRFRSCRQARPFPGGALQPRRQRGLRGSCQSPMENGQGAASVRR